MLVETEEGIMGDLMRGNFKTKKKVQAPDQKNLSLETIYEKEALKKLGGSIAFVAKKKVMWDLNKKTDEKD